MAVNYQGAAGYDVGQSENRSRFANADVSELATTLVSNQRPGGPQSFNIAGGIGVVGDTYVKPNKLLTEDERSCNPNVSNISSSIPTKGKLGISETDQQGRNVYGETENNRETAAFAGLVDNQLKENPFYNLRRQ